MTRAGWTSANSGPDYRAGDDKPTIAGFLSARLDEVEAAAKAAPGCTWHAFGEDDIAGASVYDGQWLLLSPARYEHDNALSSKPGATGPQYIQRARDELCAHVALHDPARVLREVAAGRAILARCLEFIEAGTIPRGATWSDDAAGAVAAEAVLAELAAVWSDHKDYDPAWRP